MALVQKMCGAIKNKRFFSAILRDETENTIYSNLTERFPIEYTGKYALYLCMLYLQIKHNTVACNENSEGTAMVLYSRVVIPN